MNNGYAILKQDSLHKESNKLLLLAVVLLIVSFVSMNFVRVVPLPEHYSNTDGTYQLTIDNGQGKPSYYVNDIELSEVKSISSNLEYIRYNWNFRAIGLFIIVFVLFFIAFMILWLANPNINYYLYLLENKLSRVKALPLPHISQAPGGIIAVRAWGTNKKGFLKSTGRGVIWQSSKVKADVNPAVKGQSGIYAYRLGVRLEDLDFISFSPKVWGIVSLSGHCVGHKDNVIRASNCVILMLFTNKESLISLLQQHYHCPVLLSSNPIKSIGIWQLTHEGLFWMQHNYKLIRKNIDMKIEDDISQIITQKQF